MEKADLASNADATVRVLRQGLKWFQARGELDSAEKCARQLFDFMEKNRDWNYHDTVYEACRLADVLAEQGRF